MAQFRLLFSLLSLTGDCGTGKIECAGNNALPPATLFEITLDGYGGPSEGIGVSGRISRHLTFSGVWSAVDSVSSSLSGMGVRKGHVVLLLSPNSIFFPIGCLSVISLGAVITTTNPLNTTQEVAKQIADSKPVLPFTTPPLLSKIADSNLPIVIIGEKSTANATPMAQDRIPPTDPRSGFSKSSCSGPACGCSPSCDCKPECHC
ncbi:hypothetical protein C3L33_11185, partial [Rhododendron williamsianum]